MREGGLEAPVRRPVPWRDGDFYDSKKLDDELRRVFDICHGCRRCFNLCGSFPRLFGLIDESGTGELDGVGSAAFKPVVDACTLCGMCFMTKCPYVPPHEFDLDVPHLMLRHRAAETRNGKPGLVKSQLTETDRNGRLAGMAAPLVNWACDCNNRLTRHLMGALTGVHPEAHLPSYASKTFLSRARCEAPEVNREAPAFGRKAVIFATCIGNYNNPDIGLAARAVLARNGVETEVLYPECCGMPQLEHGDFARVAGKAERTAAHMKEWTGKGYDVVSLVASCSLMMKFEWPLICPENEDVENLAQATFDVSEYVSGIAGKEGLAEGLESLGGEVALHIPCHARAQNMGRKAAEMLKHLPDTKVSVIERCSGHGGAWGVMKGNFEVALKVGKPVARQAAQVAQVAKDKPAFIVSECPLAREHIIQGIERLNEEPFAVEHFQHPIQLMARAYGADRAGAKGG